MYKEEITFDLDQAECSPFEIEKITTVEEASPESSDDDMFFLNFFYDHKIIKKLLPHEV